MRTRTVRYFAYLPTRVEGKIIWLKNYNMEQEYKLCKKWRDNGYPDPGEEYFEMDWVDIKYKFIKIDNNVK